MHMRAFCMLATLVLSHLKFRTILSSSFFFQISTFVLTMSQEMNVLCCYSCKMYQVHIVKKAPKWNCKLCNAKQSVQQIYFQGSGRDCRLHVQQLNAMKANNTFLISSEQDDACDTFANISDESASDNTGNKWTKYFEASETEDVFFDKKTDDITPDDTDSESEDINNETKELCSMSFNHNSCINDSCDMPDNTKSNGDCINAVNIFETYDELDDPLDF